MATWYWKDSNFNEDWESPGNWWSNINGTGSHPANAPWMQNDSTKDDNLSLTTGESAVLGINDGVIGSGFTITGVCDIPNITNSGGAIYGGTWTGNAFAHESGGGIYGGTFTGGNFLCDATIFGGTFTGDGFVNTGEISGGTFSGLIISQQNQISGGTFTGRAVYGLYRYGFGNLVSSTLAIITFTNYDADAIDPVISGMG